MSRGFDSFEIDDSRGTDSSSGRDTGRGSSSSGDKWRELQNIYREEERSDNLAREGQHRSSRERSPLPREERIREILKQRTRTAYADRNRTYSLRDSEIYTLSEVGKFRVVAKNDLAEFAYNGDRSRMENDVENLEREGLAKVTTIPDSDYNPSQVVTLRKEGHKLLSRGKVLPSSQAIYHGLKNPKYRMMCILAGSSGCRIGEILGLEIKDLLDDFTTIRVIQQAKGANLTTELKTVNSERFVDICPEVAALIKEFLQGRTSGLVLPSRMGKPLNPSNLRTRVIHPLLKKKRVPLGGAHIFRRFRITWLRENSVQPDIERFWLGHANQTVGDDYSMLKKNVKFRKQIADKIGPGFELPGSIFAPVVPNVPKMAVKTEEEVLV